MFMNINGLYVWVYVFVFFVYRQHILHLPNLCRKFVEKFLALAK